MKKTSDLIWQDAQHQQLFQLIDDINHASVDDSVFQRLFDYAENHFRLEEEYMTRLNFPDAKEHIHAHDKFREELTIMMRDCSEYDEVFRLALSEFLTGWLKGHIFGIDKKLEQFILQSDKK
jgi:hemerythrin